MREAEVQQLKDATQEVGLGRGGWVSIRGERGTGKTWLVTRSDLRSHALVEERLPLMLGTFEPQKPHSGFQDLLIAAARHVERHHGPDEIGRLIGRWGRDLTTLFPLFARCVAILDLP